MTTLLYLAPIALVIGLIGSGRVPLIGAALAGLAATLLATYFALDGSQSFLAFTLQESLKGAWLAWHAVSVILAGLVLHHTAQDHAASAEETLTAGKHRQAYRLCFLAGPFVESAVGFGVGYAVTIIGLRRLGAPAHAAVALGFLSQMLVPWGALAIGSVIGAALGNLPLIELGTNSAMLMPPFLAALLGWLWWWSQRLSFGFGWRAAMGDLAWTAALALLLIAANLYGAVDAAGLFATGPLLALSYLPALLRRDRMTLLRPALPYLLLVAALLLTRLMPGISPWLQSAAVIAPFPELPNFPLLYHPAILLLAVALLYGMGIGRAKDTGAVLRVSWRSGRIAVASTIIFIVMARLFATSGMAATLAQSWQGFAGDAALLATPAFAALAGGMTGSNTASNSLMLPMQAALAGSVGASVAWTSALQNVTGSLFTSFFPGKVALACAFAGWAGGERQAYRAMLPLGLILLPIGIAIAAFF